MFLKAYHALRMMLLALVVQIGNLAKIKIRKGYDDKYEHQRKPRQVESHLMQEPKWDLNDPPRFPLDDPSKYLLGLTGKFEPESDLPTVNLSDDSPRFATNSHSMCSGPLCG